MVKICMSGLYGGSFFYITGIEIEEFKVLIKKELLVVDKVIEKKIIFLVCFLKMSKFNS